MHASSPARSVKNELTINTMLPPVVRRKPLPPSATIPNMKSLSILPGSATHPTMRRTWIDENGVQRSTETLEPITPIINFVQEFLPPNSPQIYGDQLFPVLPYCGINRDDEALQNDGDLVVCIGQDVELRMNSSVIRNSKYRSLIDRLQELTDEESADITQAAHYSDSPIRYVLELQSSHSVGYTRHRTSIRNFFAALQNNPITGEVLIAELDHLHMTAIELIGESHDPQKALRFVRRYVQRLKLDDCRYFRSNAVRMLAWCERTRWAKGWIESFAHCVGMMRNGIQDYGECLELSPRTKRLLEKAHRKQRHEVRAMQGILADFDMVRNPTEYDAAQDAGLKATRAFQQFLIDYYSKLYGSWPPPTEDDSDFWLTRTLAQKLQEDFGGLYDLLVDNKIVYGVREHGEMPQLLTLDDETGELQPLQTSATASVFPLWDVMQLWDERCDFDPSPHPWVLLPKLRRLSGIGNLTHQQSLVPAIRQYETERIEEQSGLRNAYMKGTNSDVQLTNFTRAFLKHETNTKFEGVNTHDARLGRWLIIYCTMQLLSRIAVDIQGLWYCHGVPYFLNAELRHCPPWPGAEIPKTIREANVQDSWCYIYAKGLAEAKARKKVNQEKEERTTRPKYRVKWHSDGRWQLSPIRDRDVKRASD